MTGETAQPSGAAAIAPAQSADTSRPPGVPEWVDMEAADAAQAEKDALQASELAAARAASVPKHSIGYIEPRLPPGMALPPVAVMTELRQAAHAEQMTKGEYGQFAMVVALAVRDAELAPQIDPYNSKNLALVTKWYGADTQAKLEGANRQKNRLIAAYPQLQNVFKGHVLANAYMVRQLVAMDERRGGK